MFKKIISIVSMFLISCVSVDYKRLAYNSVAMIKFSGTEQKTKNDLYVTGTAFAIDKNYLLTAGHVCQSRR